MRKAFKQRKMNEKDDLYKARAIANPYPTLLPTLS